MQQQDEPCTVIVRPAPHRFACAIRPRAKVSPSFGSPRGPSAPFPRARRSLPRRRRKAPRPPPSFRLASPTCATRLPDATRRDGVSRQRRLPIRSTTPTPPLRPSAAATPRPRPPSWICTYRALVLYLVKGCTRELNDFPIILSTKGSRGTLPRSGGDADPRVLRVRRFVVPGVGRRGASGRGAAAGILLWRHPGAPHWPPLLCSFPVLFQGRVHLHGGVP